MSIKAMKQALDALETHAAIGVRADKAIAALQQAIAEAEKQEPFGYMPDWAVNQLNGSLVYEKPLTWGLNTHVYVGPVDGYIPIYNAPLQRQPRKRKWVWLTDEKIRGIAKQHALSLAFPCDSPTTPEMFARAIEAKSRELNT